MKRLHSYWTYPFVLHPLAFAVAVPLFLFDEFNFSWGLLGVVLLIEAALIGGFIAILTDLKRLYLQDDTLFIYDLYSQIPYEVPSEQLRDLKRDNSRYAFIWGIYIATFEVDGGQVDIKFMKNKSIWNIRKYI